MTDPSLDSEVRTHACVSLGLSVGYPWLPGFRVFPQDRSLTDRAVTYQIDERNGNKAEHFNRIEHIDIDKDSGCQRRDRTS